MARKRSNQAKWMHNPRNVSWTIAQLTYESTELPHKYGYGDFRNPRQVVQETIRQRKYENSKAGIRERLLKRLRGLSEGE